MIIHKGDFIKDTTWAYELNFLKLPFFAIMHPLPQNPLLLSMALIVEDFGFKKFVSNWQMLLHGDTASLRA